MEQALSGLVESPAASPLLSKKDSSVLKAKNLRDSAFRASLTSKLSKMSGVGADEAHDGLAKLVYAKTRLDRGYSPVCLYIPSR